MNKELLFTGIGILLWFGLFIAFSAAVDSVPEKTTTTETIMFVTTLLTAGIMFVIVGIFG